MDTSTWTWATAATAVAILIVEFVRRRWKAADEKAEAAKAARAEIAVLEGEWRKAVAVMDRDRAITLRKRITEVEKLLLCWGFLLLLSGCRTPHVQAVVLDEHVRIVHAGDTVPPLPDGEAGWWLCTPTGLTMLLPASSPVLDLEVKNAGR